MTPAFRLRAKHVIHAVGPVWRGGGFGEPEQLANAYRNAMRAAADAGARSIAFPAISTGVYGYPLDDATAIAVAAVRDALRDDAAPERVVFCCFSAEAETAYRRALARE